MILVSAGHYEDAQGAEWSGVTEWSQTTLWRDLIVQYLGDLGEAVPDGTLQEKVEYINSAQAVAAVEIHFNSAMLDGVNVGRGCETLHYPGSAAGEELAICVHKALAADFEPDRGVKEGTFHMKPNGEPLYFLQATTAPAVILEPDFIHRVYQIERRRTHCCMAIARQLMLLMERWGLI